MRPIKLRHILQEAKQDIPFVSNFFKQFPRNAKNWADATDEVKEIARLARETYEEIDGVKIQPIPWKSLSSPSEWNSKYQDYTFKVYSKMSEAAKTEFVRQAKQYFNE